VWLSCSVRHIRSIERNSERSQVDRSVVMSVFYLPQSVRGDVEVAVDGLKGAGLLEFNSRGDTPEFARRGYTIHGNDL